MQKCVFALAFFVSHVPSKKAFGDFVHFASCFFRSAFRPRPRRLQTAKKVPSSRHVRMDGTHTGKLSAESVRGRKAECAVQRSILSPRGSRAKRVQWTKQRRRGWRSAPVFASAHRGAPRKSAKRKRARGKEFLSCAAGRNGFPLERVAKATR